MLHDSSCHLNLDAIRSEDLSRSRLHLQMEHVEVDVHQTLAQVQALVERRTGVTQQQQRLLIAGAQQPDTASCGCQLLAPASPAGCHCTGRLPLSEAWVTACSSAAPHADVHRVSCDCE